LDASADSLILENDKDLAKYRNIIQDYGTNDFIVMTLSPNNGDIFDEENISIIKSLKNRILSIDNVESVISLIDVPLVESSDTPLIEMINNVPTLLSNNTDKIKAKKEILDSPIYKNLIISEDGTTTALQINLSSNPELLELNKIKASLVSKKISGDITSLEVLRLETIKSEYKTIKSLYDKQIHNLLKQARDVQKEFMEIHDIELRMGGIPMIADDMILYVKNDLINFGLGVFIFIVLTLIVIFRSIKWVVLPVLSCIYAVIFMIGLLGLLNWEVTVISSNFISLMLILTLSMNIHLIVRYRQISSEASKQVEAVYETTKQMVWPCLYTALDNYSCICFLEF
jgi:predicted RND superfamily exporter protein